MKQLLLVCFFFSLTFGSNLQAQEASDLELIQETITKYFDGWLTGNAELIGEAMHESCHLKFLREGKFELRNKEGYLSGFKPRPRLENAEGRIVSVDITRNAASAKIELEIPGRLFTDYFNLLKLDGVWYITDKASTNIALE